ncbi:hypothetical protein C8A05DRAFT_18679 [Staphylotrichum tortipilum]|uniref:Uncharacterized protein n=1 Tax=Staphylotrichum tortipilum TaxID=2831512 RepID=A0AAN6MEJ5_9PEZI|nr:hypothetical protein C8A05DRAFT_18679 [Staphylotrichum longicolle]
MSSDNGNSANNANDMARQRRGSITSSAFTSLFRNNSVSQPPTSYPTPLAAAAVNDQRRRLSVTTLGLSGTSPTTPSAFLRRGSLSTNADSIDENAIDDEEGPRGPPVTPFSRRMSFGATQAMRNTRGGTSPGTGMQTQPLRRASTVRGSPTAPAPSAGSGNYTWNKITSQASSANQSRTGSDLSSAPARSDQGFNWSEQLRSRAESTVAAGPRASFSFASGLSASPPRPAPPATSPRHDRARSVSDMPAPPAQAPKPRAPQKPDHFQERILKGDFYMD